MQDWASIIGKCIDFMYSIVRSFYLLALNRATIRSGVVEVDGAPYLCICEKVFYPRLVVGVMADVVADM